MGIRGAHAAPPLGLILVAVALAAAPAHADTFTVTKRGDPVPGACTPRDCSLREAVVAANARAGADRVVLPSRRAHQLRIVDQGTGAADGDLDVSGPLSVVHPGRGRATVDFHPTGFQDPIDRIFEVEPQSSLTLRKLVLREGGDPSTVAHGGAILAYGDLRVINSRLVRSESPGFGGAIAAQSGADVVLRRSVVGGNEAASYGGGVYHQTAGNGKLTIVRSRFIANRSLTQEGGGLYFNGEDGSSITTSVFARNRADRDGGGLYIDTGELRIARSTVSDNRAGRDGGGIHLDSTDPTLIVNTTVAGNRAGGVGGGIGAETDARINAVTVARNRANADGTGSESGGGIAFEADDTVSVENSLIALNSALPPIPGEPAFPSDCSGGAAGYSAGQNLLSTRDGCDTFSAPGDRVRRNPRIGKLRRNGGPTQTIALLRRSPALNRADAATAPKIDQRGRRRSNPDIGAFERR